MTRRQAPAPLNALRLLVFGAVLLGYAKVATGADVALMSVLVALAAAFLGLALVGPWVLALLGRLIAARASTPTMLLVGRRLADDPRTTWRTVGGITLAAFIAGFLAPYSAGDGHSLGTTSALVVAAPAGQAPSLATAAKRTLDVARVPATVTTRFDPVLGTKPDRLVVAVTVDDPRHLEQVKTILHSLSPGQPPVSEDDINWRDRQFASDYRVVGLLVLAVSFGIATASATITTAASVIDQRRTIRLLYLAGTPMTVLYRTHTAQVLVPLLVTGGGGLLVGLTCAAPYTWLSGAPIDLAGIGVLMACAVSGAACTVLATTLSRPLVSAMRAVSE